MSKSPDAFRTISEVAEWLDEPAHVLRFWESKFTQVKPVKRAGGRRYYRPEDIALLGGIKKLLHDDGMTIKGVQKILREQGVKYVAALSPNIGDIAPDTISGAAMPPAPPTAEPPQSAPVDTVVAFQRADTPKAPPADAPAAPPASVSVLAENGMPHDSDTPIEVETAPVTAELPSDAPEAPVLVEADLPDPPHKTEVFPPADDAPPAARDIPSFLRPAPAEPPTVDTAPVAPEPATPPAPMQDRGRDTGPTPETPPAQHTAPDAADNIAEPAAVEPAPEPARPVPPRPQVIDVADVPPLDQIIAPPGLLSLIAARKTPLSASARGKLTDALSDLRRLRDRLDQQARD